MKTIFITVFHGHIARNILREPVVFFLTQDPTVRVVLIVPAFKRDFYDKEFGGPRVIVEAAPEILRTRLDKFFRSFYYYFTDTKTVKTIHEEQFLITGRYLKYWYIRMMTKIFGHMPILRKAIRFLDERCVRDTAFASLFEKYKPDLLFVPSVTSDDESFAARQAHAHRIPVVAMPRSWDNFTVNKGNIRVVPEKLLVHGPFLKSEAIQYGDMRAEDIEVVGLSHFDHYAKQPVLSREEFLKGIGADPAKKTIFLTLIGLSAFEIDKKIVSVLENAIKTRPELKNVQLLVRPHPNENKPIEFVDKNITVVNSPGMIDFSGGKLTDREFTPEDMQFLATALRYSDIVINTQSTTTIDAAAFDKPVINVGFDEIPNKPYHKSLRRFYDYTHYVPIMQSGGIRMAWTEEELVQWVIEYLKNPALDREGRKRIMAEQNGDIPLGTASEHTAKAVLRMLSR